MRGMICRRFPHRLKMDRLRPYALRVLTLLLMTILYGDLIAHIRLERSAVIRANNAGLIDIWSLRALTVLSCRRLQC